MMANPPARARTVIGVVAKILNMNPNRILGDSRSPLVVRGRWAAVWIMVHELGYGRSQVARAFNRDPSSIFYAFKRMKEADHDLVRGTMEILRRAHPEVLECGIEIEGEAA